MEYLKAFSLDSTTNTITYGTSQPNDVPTTTRTNPVTVHSFLPDGTGTSFSFDMTTGCCTKPTLTAATLADQTYYLSSTAGSFDMPTFTADATCCTEADFAYTFSVTPSPSISLIITFDADSTSATFRQFTWQTKESADIGDYTVTVTATLNCATPVPTTFVLKVADPCPFATLTIDGDTSLFTSVTDALT